MCLALASQWFNNGIFIGCLSGGLVGIFAGSVVTLWLKR